MTARRFSMISKPGAPHGGEKNRYKGGAKASLLKQGHTKTQDMTAGTKVLHDPHKFIGIFRKGTGQLEELLAFCRQFYTAILANKSPTPNSFSRVWMALDREGCRNMELLRRLGQISAGADSLEIAQLDEVHDRLLIP